MRKPYALLLLVPLVIGSTTPGAMGSAARCNKSPRAESSNLAKVTDTTFEERDYLARTIAFEASGETEEGKIAVAYVIINRKRSGRWGDNIKDVVTSPWQFEPWMAKRGEIEKLSADDPNYQSAAKIADDVLTGVSSDPTAGATHFLNPIIVRDRRGGSLPTWARGQGLPIGRHVFYSPNQTLASAKRDGLASRG